MNLEMHYEDMDLSSIPMDFRHNCKFLCQLIECKSKNNMILEPLQTLLRNRDQKIPQALNRRQKTILKRIIEGLNLDDAESFDPPVPEELEASIRVKPRGGRLPWEAEAIRKIDLWRKDVKVLCEHIAPKNISTLLKVPRRRGSVRCYEKISKDP